MLPTNTVFYETPLSYEGIPNNSPAASQAIAVCDIFNNFKSVSNSEFYIDDFLCIITVLLTSTVYAKRLNKRLEVLISALVHDIKTPLTIIKGNADLLS